VENDLLFQVQPGTRFQAEPLGAAGIELQNVFDRPIAAVGRADGDGARRRLGVDFQQAAVAVEKEQVQRNIGVFHPERGRGSLRLNKEHAVIGGQAGAKHQSLLSFLESFRDFDMEAVVIDPDVGCVGGPAGLTESTGQRDGHRQQQVAEAVKPGESKMD